MKDFPMIFIWSFLYRCHFSGWYFSKRFFFSRWLFSWYQVYHFVANILLIRKHAGDI